MADDRANNPARKPNLPYKGLEGKKNIASVSLPSRNNNTPGSNEHDFGGGRLQVSEYSRAERGPREMTKFDKNDPNHVSMLTATDGSNEGMMMHEGGYFSFPKKKESAKTKNTTGSKAATAPKKRAPAPKKKAPTPKPEAPAPKTEAPAPKKTITLGKNMGWLEKARAAEAAAKASGKIKDRAAEPRDE
jgi:hypothetical protein